jgi:hypothetical protein
VRGLSPGWSCSSTGLCGSVGTLAQNKGTNVACEFRLTMHIGTKPDAEVQNPTRTLDIHCSWTLMYLGYPDLDS